MFENLKKKYAHFYTKRVFLKKNLPAINYNKILSSSSDYLVIMPVEDNDFYHCLDILKYYLIHKKIITLFLPEYKYSLIPEKEKYKFLSFLPEHLNKFRLPKAILINRLKSKEYDVVIDLNRSSDIFFSTVANIVNSKVRVGFTRDSFENYYSLLISDKSANSENAYQNFLNYLRMF
jgi:hypothetical protein